MSELFVISEVASLCIAQIGSKILEIILDKFYKMRLIISMKFLKDYFENDGYIQSIGKHYIFFDRIFAPKKLTKEIKINFKPIVKDKFKLFRKFPGTNVRKLINSMEFGKIVEIRGNRLAGKSFFIKNLLISNVFHKEFDKNYLKIDVVETKNEYCYEWFFNFHKEYLTGDMFSKENYNKYLNSIRNVKTLNKFIKEIENLLLLAKKENYQNRILILEGMQLFLSDREEGTLIFKKQLSLLESYYDTIIVTSIENGMNEEISNQLEDIFSSKINKKNLSIKNLFVKSYIFEDLFTEKSHYIIEFDNIVSENFSVSIKNSQSKLINLKSSTNCQPYIFFDKTVHNDKKNISYIVLNNFLQEKEL